MEGLKLIPYIALVLTIAGVILGAAVISVAKFGDTMTECDINNGSYTLNGAKTACTGAAGAQIPTTGPSGTNLSQEYYTKSQAQEGLLTVAEQQPTVAIIAVMVIIISIIAGVFVYMRYFG